jgi:hypothetical protein
VFICLMLSWGEFLYRLGSKSGQDAVGDTTRAPGSEFHWQ